MKVTVVGAGNVGATLALRIAQKRLASQVVMLDVVEGLPQGKALDLAQSAPIEGFDTQVIGTNTYDLASDSDIVVITAGLTRKPGMSRDDLLLKNAEIVRTVTQSIAARAGSAIIIMVTNPLDVMACVALKESQFEPHRVVGMAGLLDTARFRHFVAEALNVSVQDVTALVLGGHGDSMVPLPRCCSVAGIPLTELMDAAAIEQLVERTRNAGAEIVAHLKTGSAFYAPSASAAQMVEAIVTDSKRVLPCAAWLTGQYGISGVFLGVPVKLGAAGVEEVVEIELAPHEHQALKRSAEHVRQAISRLNL